MFLTQNKRTATPARKLHSISGLLNERNFQGKIEVGKLAYTFTYKLGAAQIVNGKLELTGNFSVKSPVGKTAQTSKVTATLRGTQGSIGTSTKPASFKMTAPSAFPADPQDGKLITEYTNSRSAVGVLYFALAPLNGQALGLPYDLSAVQLNGRLTGADQTGRELQWLFNQAYAALDASNPSMAEPYVTAIEQLLRA
jgi:hypothetical protein